METFLRLKDPRFRIPRLVASSQGRLRDAFTRDSVLFFGLEDGGLDSHVPSRGVTDEAADTGLHSQIFFSLSLALS